ncbi:hypothetical protein EC957_010521 [Mortierella hygrophila]|uniref:Poly(A) RNA polymerase mitochondrial-like central palm domain-containing protein n=1 Tax=Mortierella hygrophila TaxID=979708 RepID=A0A9P6K4E1_9FUNG|nr:hypothetical protein EC957_010521 [Mortierella hygrophila]
MPFNPKEFTEVLLGVILFECASQPKNKYTFRELACAFYNARLLLRFDSNLNSSSSHVYIQEHKLYTTQGLIQYVHSLHRGNNGYFPCSTSHIRKVQCHLFDTDNASYDDEFVYLRACSSTEMDNFFSNYAEKVPSAFHDYIAAVVEHLRDCCWGEHRGSGGVGVVLSSLAGTLGVAKYSMEHNAHERLRRRQYLPDKIARQTSFLQRFQVAQMGREYRERVRLEREYRERERLERDVRLMQKKKEEARRMQKEEVRRARKEKEDQERERILKDMRRMQKEKEDQEQERMLKDMRRMRIIEGYKANQQRLHQQQLQHIDAPHLADINLYLNELKLQVATADTRRNVDTLRQTLETTLRTYPRFRNAEVSLFGSFESGLSTLTSDADFTVSNLVGLTIEPIHDLARALQLSGYGPIKTVADARVPIVTFTGQGIRCDMNINHPMGVFNSQLIHAYQKIDTRFLGIWFGLRTLADKHGILNGKTQYLTSYALTMMLIVFLQDVTSPPILPRLQQQSTYKMTTRIIDGYHCSYDKYARNYSELAAKNTKTHGELLKEFCQYFGHTFNYATQEVNPCLGVIRNRSVKPPPRTLTDSRPKEWPICVLDPFVTDRNVAGNCRGINVAVIQRCFRTVHDALAKDDIKKAFKV